MSPGRRTCGENDSIYAITRRPPDTVTWSADLAVGHQTTPWWAELAARRHRRSDETFVGGKQPGHRSDFRWNSRKDDRRAAHARVHRRTEGVSLSSPRNCGPSGSPAPRRERG